MVTILEYGQVVIGGDEQNRKGKQPGQIDSKGEGPGHEVDDLRITPLEPVPLESAASTQAP